MVQDTTTLLTASFERFLCNAIDSLLMYYFGPLSIDVNESFRGVAGL